MGGYGVLLSVSEMCDGEKDSFEDVLDTEIISSLDLEADEIIELEGDVIDLSKDDILD